jgi:polyribonucleotide 5'-hydroxyl-kinase
MVINTLGWVDNEGYKILLDVIEACQPSVLLVLGHEKLYSTLATDIKNAKDLKLVKLPKSGGV